MNKDFRQIDWDLSVAEDWREVLRLAIREDLGRAFDWTTGLLVTDEAQGQAAVVARQAGVIAGLPAAKMVLHEFDPRAIWRQRVEDGSRVAAGDEVATIAGPARSLLTAERLLLNVLGRLSGIATLTSCFVQAVAGSRAQIYDTRKTTPGWRRLEKYAVRQGGGRNHRLGLFDGVLIKDNHLALGARSEGSQRYSPAEAVLRAQEFRRGFEPPDPRADLLIEIEVDDLDQLNAVLPVRPDLVLLDNMPPAMLREAVARRGAGFPEVQLEASGGVRLETVAEIAATGVDRISAGALTHGAVWLDVGLDWK